MSEANVLNKEASENCRMSARELSVELAGTAKLPTEWGDFQIAGYRSLNSEEEFVALFKGEMKRDVPKIGRAHV